MGTKSDGAAKELKPKRRSGNKQKVVAIIILTVCILVLAAGVAAGIYFTIKNDRYSGYVTDGNGMPMEGVAVTNGRDVVKTDENGHYVMDGWLKDRFVTVTIPTGYWTEDYYMEVGDARDGYDFTLEKLDEDYTNHTFLQVSDSEVGADGVGEWIDNVKQTAEETNAAFIIHTGDICYEDGLRTHLSGMNSGNMPAPVRYIMGNHDYINWGGYGEAYFESIYGPTCYSFEVGNIHYVVTPIVHGTDYLGRYTNADVWRWVKNDLENTDPDMKVVIFNHDYCTSDEDGFVVKYGLGNKLDLKEYGLVAWLYGHWHYNLMYQTESGAFNICTGQPHGGGIDSTVPGVRSVYMEGGTLKSSEIHYYDFETDAAPQSGFDWTVNVGGNGYFAEPVVRGDYVYVATADDGWPKECGVYKLNASTGEKVWEYATEDSIRNSVYLTEDGKLLAQDVRGKVYCLNAENGKLIWDRDTELSAVRNTGLGVIADGDKVYCGGAQKSVCLNLSDGSLVWETKNSRANSSPTRMVVSGDLLLVGSHWDELIAYDKNTGKRVWSNDGDGIRYRTSTPFIYEGGIYVTTGSSIPELDPSDGEVKRSASFEGFNFDTAAIPYISGDVVYLGTADSGLAAVNLQTLELEWNFTGIGGALVSSTPYTQPGTKQIQSGVVELNGSLYFGGMDGFVYKLDKQGKPLARTEVCSPILAAPAIYRDSLIVVDFSGNVTKVTL